MKSIRQEPVLDFTNLSISMLKSVENQLSKFNIRPRDLFNKVVPIRRQGSNLSSGGLPPPPPLPKRDLDIRPLNAVEISGYYKVTGTYEATFYSITTWPLEPIGKGWIIDGAPGLRGQLFMASARNEGGADFKWSFTFQADMDQSIEDEKMYVTTATLYPPGRMSVKRAAPIYGYYDIVKHVPRFYFATPPIADTKAGWIIEGLPTLSVPYFITEFDLDVPQKKINKEGTRFYEVLVTVATLRSTDGSIPEDAGPVTVKGFPVLIREPDPTNEYTPGRFVKKPKTTEVIRAPENIKIGNPPPLRDLGEIDPILEKPEGFPESKGRGFSQGSVISLAATGPQDEYLVSKDLNDSQWNPDFKQYSNFVMFQRIIPLSFSPVYQGRVFQVEMKPTEMGHLLSNMYLKLSLPALAGGFAYNPEGGRAIIKQVDFIINETVVETLYDDWYIIRDQVLLDADEQAALRIALATPSTGGDVVIPLDLFFCRRHSHANKNRERLRRPYFPLCAMFNQRLYIRFTFNPSSWWSNSTTTVDFTNPKLITEEIILNTEEKLYYQTTPLKYIVNRVTRETGLSFQQINPVIQLSANYPVQMLTWFFRKKTYEDPVNTRFVDSRYTYGYTTKYIKSGINLNFPSGKNAQYIDVIESAKITLNNVDILSTFQGSLYYSFKQPMEHGLSIPSKNIYTYSFGLNPKEYNQGGYINFAKLTSQITTLSLAFGPSYATQLATGYTLYIFYYGYTLLEFQNGYASTPFV